jgi:hypothetical protein
METPVYEQKCTHPILKSTNVVDDITTSSDYRSGELVLYSGSEAVVDGKGWIVNPDRDAARELTIKFTKATTVTGFSVKQQNVVAFTVLFSTDGKLFTPYLEAGRPKSFQGANFPSGKYESAFFKPEVTTVYLRFKITAVDTVSDKLAFPKLNIEVLGCYHQPTACKEMEGLVDPLIIDDSMIAGVPTVPTSSVTDIRPQSAGWTVPVKSPVKPTITITLTKTKNPVKVQKLQVSGNVGSGTLKYTQQPDSAAIQPGTEESKTDSSVKGTILITFTPYIEATSIVFTVDKPADENVDYNLHMTVIACFEKSDSAVTEAPSTTVAPTTTVTTTTEAVTGTTSAPVVSTTVTVTPTSPESGTTVAPEGTTPSVPGTSTDATTAGSTTTIGAGQTTTGTTTGMPTADTTVVTETTVASTTVSVPKVPCLTNMKNSGVVPEDKLQVTYVVSNEGNTIIIIKSKLADNEDPTWVKFTLTAGETKQFTVTLLDKNNSPVKDTKTVPALEPSKPIDFSLDEPTKANYVVIVLTPSSSTPTTSKLQYVVACIEDKELMTTVVPTTASPTTIATTVSQPDSTTGLTTTAPTTAEPTTVGSSTTASVPSETTAVTTAATTAATTASTTVETTASPTAATTVGSESTPVTTVSSTTIPTTGSPTTVAPTSTVSPPVSDVPCLKNMKDSGVTPKSELNVVSTQEGDKTILTVTSKNAGETPVFVGATIKPGNLKSVTIALLDPTGTPLEKVEQTVSDPTKPTAVKFTEPKPASTLKIELTSSTDKPTTADLESIVACMETKKEETTTMTTVPTTAVPTSVSTATTAGAETTTASVPQPETTTAASTTMSPTTVIETTVASSTTISAPVSDTPCLKGMKDNGVVPTSNVNVVTKQEGDKTIITVTSKKPDETPVFVGAIITPGQLTEVTVTLLDQNNNPVGNTE